MLATTTISIRTDENIKKQAQELYASLGLDLSGAINAFLHASLKARGIPFAIVEEPDEEYKAYITKTIAERLERSKDPNTKWYTVDEMKEKLGLL